MRIILKIIMTVVVEIIIVIIGDTIIVVLIQRTSAVISSMEYAVYFKVTILWFWKCNCT